MRIVGLPIVCLVLLAALAIKAGTAAFASSGYRTLAGSDGRAPGRSAEHPDEGGQA